MDGDKITVRRHLVNSITISDTTTYNNAVSSSQHDINNDETQQSANNIKSSQQIIDDSNDTIIDFDICVLKPIVIVAGQINHNIQIWNYIKGDLLLHQKFLETPSSVSIHPLGHHAIIGFSDKLRLMNVLYDDQFRCIWHYPIKMCRECKFSKGGHLFAAVQGTSILLFDFHNKRKIFELKGHNNRIYKLVWDTYDDSFIVSCDEDGTIYCWCVKTGQRVGEYFRKGGARAFQCCGVMAMDGTRALWIVDGGKLHKLSIPTLERIQSQSSSSSSSSSDEQHDENEEEFYHKDPQNSTMFEEPLACTTKKSTNPQLVFVASKEDTNVLNIFHTNTNANGQHNEYLSTVQLNITNNSKLHTNLHQQYTSSIATNNKIDALKIINDRFLLVMDSKKTFLHVFEIQNRQHRRQSLITTVQNIEDYAPSNAGWNEDVLVSRNDLEEKNNLITELHNEVEELIHQNDYQLRLKELSTIEDINEINEANAQALEKERLKLKRLMRQSELKEQDNENLLKQMDEQFDTKLQDCECNNQQQLLRAVDNYHATLKRIKTDRELKKKEKSQLEENQHNHLKDLTFSLRNELEEKRKLRLKLEAEICEKEKEIKEMKDQFEDDIDEEVEKLKIMYKERIEKEKNETTQFTGDNSILRKKVQNMRNEIENKKERVKILLQKEEEMRDTIKEREELIETEKRKIESKENIITTKINMIAELKKKNQELEKFQRVLQFGEVELQKRIAPREKEASDVKKQIAGIHMALDHYHESNTELGDTITSTQKLIDEKQKVVLNKRTQVKKQNALLRKLECELYLCTELIQNPDLLLEKVNGIITFISTNTRIQKIGS